MVKTFKTEELKLLGKLQDVKLEICESEPKMTGYNSFNHYKYFEHKDIIHPILKSFKKHKIAGKFDFTKKNGYLTIIDLETGYLLKWRTPLAKNTKQTKKGEQDGGMQGSQALQTYARRTLYLQALELAEVNIIEKETGKSSKSANKNKSNSKTKNKDISECNSEEILNNILEGFNRGGITPKGDLVEKRLKYLVNSKKISEDCVNEVLTLFNKIK